MRYMEITGKKLVEAEAVPDANEQSGGFYDPEQDKVEGLTLDDTRKPKLTLRMVNRLKKIRSTRDLEMAKKQELLGIMYGLGDSDEEV